MHPLLLLRCTAVLTLTAAYRPSLRSFNTTHTPASAALAHHCYPVTTAWSTLLSSVISANRKSVVWNISL